MFNLTISEDDSATMTAENTDEDVTLEMTEVEQVITETYNFGDGLAYDRDSNTLSVDSASAVEEGNTNPIQSGAVYTALNEAIYRNGNDAAYDYDEQIVGTWLDGKPLYQRVVEFNNVLLSRTRASSIAHGISDVETAIVAEAYLTDTSLSGTNGKMMNAIGGMVVNGSYYSYQLIMDDTYIWLNSTANFGATTSRTWRFVVRYTKTTDEV